MSGLVCEICGNADLPESGTACTHGAADECVICEDCLCSECKKCNLHCGCSDSAGDGDNVSSDEDSD